VLGLHKLEEKLSSIPNIRALFLRAGYFMENLLPQAGIIRSQGTMAGPIRLDLLLPMIAARDIGAAAADALSTPPSEGTRIRELLGPRDVTYSEASKIIGKAIDQPELHYVQAPSSQLKPVLLQMGMSASMVDGLLEMSDALNAGFMKPTEPRSPSSATPTTIETFVAEEFVPAYRGKASSAGSTAR